MTTDPQKKNMHKYENGKIIDKLSRVLSPYFATPHRRSFLVFKTESIRKISIKEEKEFLNNKLSDNPL